MSKVKSSMMSLDMFNFLYGDYYDSKPYVTLLEESIKNDKYYCNGSTQS